MTIETLVDELRQLERPISDRDRTYLLNEMRIYPVPSVDERRPAPSEWKRGNCYWHSLPDLRLAYTWVNMVKNCKVSQEMAEPYFRGSQACFVKDLDFYLTYFPENEEVEIRKVLELVFNVGASAYWVNDFELVRASSKNPTAFKP